MRDPAADVRSVVLDFARSLDATRAPLPAPPPEPDTVMDEPSVPHDGPELHPTAWNGAPLPDDAPSDEGDAREPADEAPVPVPAVAPDALPGHPIGGGDIAGLRGDIHQLHEAIWGMRERIALIEDRVARLPTLPWLLATAAAVLAILIGAILLGDRIHVSLR